MKLSRVDRRLILATRCLKPYGKGTLVSTVWREEDAGPGGGQRRGKSCKWPAGHLEGSSHHRQRRGRGRGRHHKSLVMGAQMCAGASAIYCRLTNWLSAAERDSSRRRDGGPSLFCLWLSLSLSALFLSRAGFKSTRPIQLAPRIVDRGGGGATSRGNAWPSPSKACR